MVRELYGSRHCKGRAEDVGNLVVVYSQIIYPAVARSSVARGQHGELRPSVVTAGQVCVGNSRKVVHQEQRSGCVVQGSGIDPLKAPTAHLAVVTICREEADFHNRKAGGRSDATSN